MEGSKGRRLSKGTVLQTVATACFWAWCFLWTSNAANADWPIADATAFPFVRLGFWLGNGLGLAAFALLLSAKKEIPNRALIIVSALVQTVGSALVVSGQSTGDVALGVLAVASFAAGFACVCYLPGWRKVIAELPARESVLFVGTSACAALALFYAALLLPRLVALGVFVCLPLAGGLFVLLDVRDVARSYALATRKRDKGGAKQTRAFRIVYLVLTVLVLAVMGFDTLGYHDASAHDETVLFWCGLVLAVGFTAVFALARSNRDVARYLVVPYMPLVVAFVFLAPFFFSDGGTLLQMAISLDFACWCFLIAIGIDAVVQSTRSRVVHGAVLGFCPIVAFAAQTLLGAGQFDAALSAGTYAIVFATAVLVMFRISFTAQREAAADDDRAAAAALVAAEHELSPRETEVFILLAHGHGQAYVQERLVIAPGTVKTHVKHIYAKLNINNREELLALVQEASSRLF